ncbi:WxcM-like domain-containing protein [Flavobacteriaceae bacterium]|nr:WxcM-like domain-containing protein [Flavobacteriaceae bacterium]
MELPKIIRGNSFTDIRGTICFNNSFDTKEIKRMYIIQNSSVNIIRGWQGHKVEQRWFSAVQGEFEIHLIEVDNWEIPSKDLQSIKYNLSSDKMNVLHIPNGYVSCIQAIENNSKLLVMADYSIDEIKDEYRYDLNYFYN